MVLREAAKRGVQRATGRIPYDPLLQKLLIDASVPFSLQELQSAPASNMMMVVNLKELLKTIAPELNRRCSILPDFSPFSLRLAVDDQTVSILVKPSSIEVLGDNHCDKYLHCDSGSFLRWLFGINGFDEWQVGVSHSLNNEEFRVMATLFRREPCASGPWG
ncbi:hypothetical protein FJZ33_01505 [Candidatus Poribacteria bacterium]|nr:hypothetical protein [Candidatus Poribacteria bacterium]